MSLTKGELTELFAERLRAARMLRGLSQRDLSQRIGVPSGTIGLFETAMRRPNIETLCRIGEALCVPTDYLLGLVDGPRLSGSREMHQIIGSDVSLLSEGDRDLARKIVRLLVKRSQKKQASDK